VKAIELLAIQLRHLRVQVKEEMLFALAAVYCHFFSPGFFFSNILHLQRIDNIGHGRSVEGKRFYARFSCHAENS